MRHGYQQVFKVAERARTNHIAFKADQVVRLFVILMQVNVEVVQPEGGHDLLQLVRAVNIPQQSLGPASLLRWFASGSRSCADIRVGRYPCHRTAWFASALSGWLEIPRIVPGGMSRICAMR